MNRILQIATMTAGLSAALSAQTILFHEPFDGSTGYNPDASTAMVGDADWVDFANRLTTAFSGTEGHATAVGGSETVLTGKPTHSDPQIRTDFAVGVNKSLVGTVTLRIRADINNDEVYDANDVMTAADVSLFYTVSRFIEPGAGNGPGPVSFGTPVVTTEADGWHLFTWPDPGGLSAGGTAPNVEGLRLDPLNNKIGISYEIDDLTIYESANPPPTVEIDPGAPVGGEFTLRESWEWNTDGDIEGWATNQFTVAIPSGISAGILTGTSSGSDAQFTSPSFLVPDVFSGRFVIEIGVESQAGDTTNKQLYWALSGGTFDPARSIITVAAPDDGGAHVYRITFDNDINGPITGLRLDPSTATSVTTKIDYIRIYSEGAEINPPVASLDPAALGAEWATYSEWTWETEDDLEGWTANSFDVPVPNDGTLGVLDGNLVGESLSGDPKLFSPGLSIPNPASKRVAVEIDFTADPFTTAGGTLFWSVDGAPITQAASTPLPLVPSDGSAHTVRVFFDNSLGGTITDLRIDPANELGVTVGIDAVRVLVDTTGDDYLLWSTGQAWTLGDANTGSADDYDGDGQDNDTERLFGLVPTDPASLNPITAPLGTNGVFTYIRRDPALSGASYRIYTSTDLSAWTEDTGAIQNATAGDLQTVDVTISKSAVNGRIFVRVGAE